MGAYTVTGQRARQMRVVPAEVLNASMPATMPRA